MCWKFWRREQGVLRSPETVFVADCIARIYYHGQGIKRKQSLVEHGCQTIRASSPIGPIRTDIVEDCDLCLAVSACDEFVRGQSPLGKI